MTRRRLRIHAAPIVLGLLFWAAPAWASDTQQSFRGGVHIAVTPASLDPQAAEWEFAVAFHSEGPALRDDVLRIASLHAGGRQFAPIAWEGTAATASHHRVGILKFAAVAPLPDAVEVWLQREGEGSPRVFRWTAGAWYALGARRQPHLTRSTGISAADTTFCATLPITARPISP